MTTGVLGVNRVVALFAAALPVFALKLEAGTQKARKSIGFFEACAVRLR